MDWTLLDSVLSESEPEGEVDAKAVLNKSKNTDIDKAVIKTETVAKAVDLDASSSITSCSVTSKQNPVAYRQEKTAQEQDEDREVLPLDPNPLKYDVTLKPDLNTFLFEGGLDVLYETDNKDVFKSGIEIVLNVRDLVLGTEGVQIIPVCLDSKEREKDQDQDQDQDRLTVFSGAGVGGESNSFSYEGQTYYLDLGGAVDVSEVGFNGYMDRVTLKFAAGNCSKSQTASSNPMMNIMDSHSIIDAKAKAKEQDDSSKQKFLLRITKFHGNLNDGLSGFYRSSYKNAEGVDTYLATTQFEPIGARRAFPCIDEPGRKAVFKINMICDSHLTAISNMPEASRTTYSDITGNGQKEKTKFEFLDSVKMSSYLIAFVVGKFDFIQGQMKSGKQSLVRCISMSDGGSYESTLVKKANLQFSLDVALKVLDYYNEYFDTPFPLPKMDMIGIPDFSAGAMENWGLVTYRLIALIIEAKTASVERKQRVATVVTHELAHQWFGNLVTMEWWNDLWLNEGFATFMMTDSANFLFPDWKYWEKYTATDQPKALTADALRSSHPISVPLKRAQQANSIFDAISYQKGSVVIRMAYGALLGEEDFKAGLKLYFAKHAYSNTKTDDLWGAWTEASKKSGKNVDVKDVMSGWTDQMGFPVLNVGIKSKQGNTAPGASGSESECDAGESEKTVLEVEQQWYLSDGSYGQVDGDDKVMWKVPIKVATGSSGKDSSYDSQVYLMKDKKTTITLESAKKADLQSGSAWVKFNARQYVPCRVLYSKELFKGLKAAISSNKNPEDPLAKETGVEASDRIGLLLDTDALVQSGHIKEAEEVVEILQCFRNSKEDNGNVWTAIKYVMGFLRHFMMNLDDSSDSSVLYEAFKGYVGGFIKKDSPFEKLGWDHKQDDSDLTKDLRGTMVTLAAKYLDREKEVQDQAWKRFEAYVADKNTNMLPEDYRKNVFQLVLQSQKSEHGDLTRSSEEAFRTLIEISKASDTIMADKIAIYTTLGYASDPKLKTELLEMSLQTEAQTGIKSQDVASVVSAVRISGREGEDLCWNWLKDNLKNGRILEKKGVLSKLVGCCIGGYTEEKAKDVEAFFSKANGVVDIEQLGLKRLVEGKVSTIRTNARTLGVYKASKLGDIEYWNGLLLGNGDQIKYNANEIECGSRCEKLQCAEGEEQFGVSEGFTFAS